nr:uncharacterized protein LOC109158014 [Ipomoea batatas]
MAFGRVCVFMLLAVIGLSIASNTGTWDEDVVRDLFVPSDVLRIFATPVSPNAQDIWRWKGGGCPFCSFDMESMDHLFCSCPEVAQVWHGSNIMLTGSLVLLINNMLCSSSVKETMHVVAKLWLIWKARNDVIWKGKTFCAVDLLQQALWLHDSWFSAYSRNTDLLADNSGSTSWTPPPTHILKCNVDAAVFEDGAGFGVVVRDHTGKFISAYSARLGKRREPFYARYVLIPHIVVIRNEWKIPNSVIQRVKMLE